MLKIIALLVLHGSQVISMTIQGADCRPRDIDKGKYFPPLDTFQDGQIIKYYCEDGYQLTGDPVGKCSSGRWSGPPPSCEIVRCTRPMTPRDGFIVEKKLFFSEKERIEFKCHPGFKMAGQAHVTCLRTNRWSHKPPMCLGFGCFPPRNFRNGAYEPIKDVYSPRDRLWFECDPNYSLYGDKDITCLRNGDWSSDFPSCNALPTCPPPKEDGQGRFFPAKDRYQLGDVTTLICDPSFQMMGHNKSLVCLPTGLWSNTEPTCRAIEPLKCYTPVSPLNGVITPEKERYAIGEEVWYKCDPGYLSRGVADIVCTEEGEWSHPVVRCVPLPNGSCHQRCGKYSPGYKCQCNIFCNFFKNCCNDFHNQCTKFSPWFFSRKFDR